MTTQLFEAERIIEICGLKYEDVLSTPYVQNIENYTIR